MAETRVPPFPVGVYLAPSGPDLWQNFIGVGSDGMVYTTRIGLHHERDRAALMAGVFFAVMLGNFPDLAFSGRLPGHEDRPDAYTEFAPLWAHGWPLAPAAADMAHVECRNSIEALDA